MAGPDGSNNFSGTAEKPLQTVQKLVDTLEPGQTGCLRAGTYTDASDDEVNIETPDVTLTSYPGERATLRTRLWIEQTSDETSIEGLDLDGRNKRQLPSPTINADDVRLIDNDITNHQTTICVSVGSPDTWGRAHDTLIEGNRIHDCGALPANNFDHGIYVNSADDTVIRGNWIYDNANRGIQLYPDAQRTLITGNVIDGNGQGIIFGGNSTSASSGNVVERNVVTNSKIRDNIESSWGGPIGTGNLARDNCVGGGAYDDGDGGILGGSPTKLGFSAQGNLIGAPAFGARDAGDFSIAPDSPCGRLLGLTVPYAHYPGSPEPDPPAEPDSPTQPDPPADPELTDPEQSGPAEITIGTERRTTKVAKPFWVRGAAPGAASVRIVIRRDGGWHGLGRFSTTEGGRYGASISVRRHGLGRIKASAAGLRDSEPIELMVVQKHRRR